MNDGDDAIDREIIDELLAMNTPSDPQFFANQRSIFVSYSSELLNNIRAAIAGNDVDGVADSLHSLKGSCANFGAIAIAAQCGKIEKKVHNIPFAEIQREVDIIQSKIETFFVFLNNLEPKG